MSVKYILLILQTTVHAIRECDVDTVCIISIKGISKVGISFLSDLGRPGKSYISMVCGCVRNDGLRPSVCVVLCSVYFYGCMDA